MKKTIKQIKGINLSTSAYTFSLFILLIFSCNNQKVPEKYYTGHGIWQPISPLSAKGRSYAISFSLNGKGFVGGGKSGTPYGNSPAADTLYDFWMYDPDNHTWSQKNNIPFTYTQSISSSVNSKGYVLSYENNSTHTINAIWKYDPDTDQWNSLPIPNFTISYYASTEFTSFVINDKIYYFFKKDMFYEYDPSTGAWSKKANFPGEERTYPSSFAIGTKGYLGMGYLYPNTKELKDFYEYDPTTDVWLQKASYPAGGLNPNNTFVINENGFTKEYGQTSISEGPCRIYQYSPLSNTWERKSDFQRNVHNMVSFNLNNHLYIGTGDASEPAFTIQGTNSIFAKGTNEFWEFIP